jgi:hypothetical protein
MPWEEAPFDQFEDALHSIAAGAVGMAFTIGVLLVTVRRGSGWTFARAFDWFAIAAALTISMLIFNLEGIGGLIQRIMFGIGYVWYASEAIRSGEEPSSAASPVTESGPEQRAFQVTELDPDRDATLAR